MINVTDNDKLRIQSCELDILKEFDRICRENNLKYSVAYGTMIGAVRHNGFIPWDDDVDVWMLRSDIEKLKEICLKDLPARFFFQTNNTDKEYFLLWDKIRDNNTVFKESFMSKYNINHGVYIDIFPLDYMPDNVVLRYFHYLHFRIYRLGIMTKYLDVNYRRGKKKVLAKLFRILFAPFSLEYLYKKAIRVAKKNGQKTNYLANMVSASGWKDVFKSELFENIVDVPFEDAIVLCIEQYDTYLTKIYGDYMVLPPEDKRVTRHELTDMKI